MRGRREFDLVAKHVTASLEYGDDDRRGVGIGIANVRDGGRIWMGENH